MKTPGFLFFRPNLEKITKDGGGVIWERILGSILAPANPGTFNLIWKMFSDRQVYYTAWAS